MVDTFTVFHLKDGYIVNKRDYTDLNDAINAIKETTNTYRAEGWDYRENKCDDELYWCRVSDGNVTHSFYIEKYLDETEYR